jgi:hypothetical protein
LIYLERTPAAPLAHWIRTLWYARAPDMPRRRERVLPGGCVQIVINLARDFLCQCGENDREDRMPASLVVGVHSVYKIVDTADMAELIGVLLQPGGFAPFASDAVNSFSNRSVALTDVWGAKAGALRDRPARSAFTVR